MHVHAGDQEMTLDLSLACQVHVHAGDQEMTLDLSLACQVHVHAGDQEITLDLPLTYSSTWLGIKNKVFSNTQLI